MAPISDDPDDPDNDSTSQENESLAQRRGKRALGNKKNSRLAALERLRESKKGSGSKFKYELEDVQNVYEKVNEDEYSKMVRDRQDDDWIVDDDGGGYVEDGREIFDDDLYGGDGEDSKGKKSSKSSVAAKDSKKLSVKQQPFSKTRDIKSMFKIGATSKHRKPQKDVSLAGDDLLDDILTDLHKEPDVIKPFVMKKKVKTPNPGSSRTGSRNPFSQTPTRPKFSSAQCSQDNDAVDAKDIKMELQTFEAKLIPRRRPAMPKKRLMDAEPGEPSKKHRPSEFTVKTEPEDVIEEYSEQNGHEDHGFEHVDIDSNEIDDFDSEVSVPTSEKPQLPDAQEEEMAAVTEQKPDVKPYFNPDACTSTGWETIREEIYADDNKDAVAADVKLDSSSLPMTTNEAGEQVFRFFWIDAYEDQYKQPGTVFLFGRVWIESARSHLSCCLTVKKIDRMIYLLPRERESAGKEVTMADVYQEFDSLATHFKIMKYKSKKVSKQYCFDKANTSAESEYLQVSYGAEYPQLPSDLQGETFSCAYGTNTSSLELLLLDRKIKGPCWLDVKMPSIPPQPISWCKVEVVLTNQAQLTVAAINAAPPPLVVMTISLRTILNQATHQNEVIAIAALIHHKFPMDKAPPQPPFHRHFCAIYKPSDCVFPFDLKETINRQKSQHIEVLSTERAILSYFLVNVYKIDPDVIVGHDIFGYDLDVLLNRINANKVPHWSRIGRLKRTVMPKLTGGFSGKGSTFSEKNATCGRSICDVKISAKELMRCKSYDLTELTKEILKRERLPIPFEEFRNMYSTSKQLIYFIEKTMLDASYIISIMCELNVLPLALQITNICGYVLSRTLMGGRSERNEYLLLHAFHDRNFICPNKEYRKKGAPAVMHVDEDEDAGGKPAVTRARRKPAYTGGLVLEPKRGFYDKHILLLDFNSLYPSIIQEYNICFTTISRSGQEEGNEEDWIPDVPDRSVETGVLPTEIRKLVERRRQVKQLMKQPDISPDLKLQYDIRQKALKLTANSMYGCLGFSQSRFYAKPLAALVTGKGREILLNTKELVQKMNLEVIYGDTDSIMINTNSSDLDQVYKIGTKVKAEVNKMYRLLEIDIDGVFQSMLLLKKKKYAALTVERHPDGKITTSQELKGLDIVRRDWSDLAKEAGNYVIGRILSADLRETIVENINSKLIEIGEKVLKNEIPLEMYEINKSLTKSPHDYPDKKSLPHVHVALWLNSQGGKKVGAGDTVSYIICQDGSDLPASQRAYHPSEVKKQDHLQIDTKYYLAHQIHPVVSRLCDPIEGTDSARIAECLGLDPASYRHTVHNRDDESDAMLGGSASLADDEKYKDADRFKFICPRPDCGKENIIDGVFSGHDKLMSCQLAECSNPQCKNVLSSHWRLMCNRVNMLIRGFVQKYYAGWMVCEDTSCGHTTRRTPLNPQRQGFMCPSCQRAILKPVYTDRDLYYQLLFFQAIFDVDRAIKKLPENEKTFANMALRDHLEGYSHLRTLVDRKLRWSKYSDVDLTSLFSGLTMALGGAMRKDASQ